MGVELFESWNPMFYSMGWSHWTIFCTIRSFRPRSILNGQHMLVGFVADQWAESPKKTEDDAGNCAFVVGREASSIIYKSNVAI